MPELRKDPIVGRWIIIATERAARPTPYKLGSPSPGSSAFCPFCPGHEDKTPPDVLAYQRGGGGGANTPNSS
ncbi:MAG: hypothetical protein V2A73_11460 [Pseudomonadota bacterium]